MTTPFGFALAGYRQRAGLSQMRLAELAELDHSIVARWEAGNRTPRRDSVERLAVALQLNAAETAHLLATAGYAAPLEPLVSELVAFLADETVPVRVRHDVRYGVMVLLRFGRRLRGVA